MKGKATNLGDRLGFALLCSLALAGLAVGINLELDPIAIDLLTHEKEARNCNLLPLLADKESLTRAAERAAGMGRNAAATCFARASLALSPLQSTLWTILASRPGEDPSAASSQLELAFLTGNEPMAISLRLAAAARLPLRPRDELQMLLASDLDRIFRERPDLVPLVERAYAVSSSSNRIVFERIAARAGVALSR